MDKEDFRIFVESMQHSSKIKQLGMFSIADYYIYDTASLPYTPKKKQETEAFRRWKKDWRQFSKTLTEQDYQNWNIAPIIGREGMIADFWVIKR